MTVTVPDRPKAPWGLGAPGPGGPARPTVRGNSSWPGNTVTDTVPVTVTQLGHRRPGPAAAAGRPGRDSWSGIPAWRLHS